MPLFWIVHEIDGKRCVFIQGAGALIFARLKASNAGFDDGEFVEAHMLDAKSARKVPKSDRPRAVISRGQRAVEPAVLTARLDRPARLAGVAAGALATWRRLGG